MLTHDEKSRHKKFARQLHVWYHRIKLYVLYAGSLTTPDD